MPRRRAALLAGTGISIIFREHDYREYLHIDFDSQNRADIAGYSYIYDSENAFGIPLALQFDYKVTERWHLTGSGSAGFYRNRDISLMLGAGVALRMVDQIRIFRISGFSE